LIAYAVVNDTGYFRLEINVNEPKEVYSYLGIYKCYIYLLPGKNYRIVLPKKIEKTIQDKLNPFFEPVEIPFLFYPYYDGVNRSIADFDIKYGQFFEALSANVRPLRKNPLLDSAVVVLSAMVDTIKDEYVKEYCHYRIGYLKAIGMVQKSRGLAGIYFENKPVLYNNTAYWQLFNFLYAKFFVYMGRGQMTKKIFEDINTFKSLDSLQVTLSGISDLKSDTLRELVILKNLHDEFYSTNFSRSGILAVLDTLIKRTKLPLNKQYALQIRSKITSLMPDYAPPSFALYDMAGKMYELTDFKGKYVYLNFCSCNSYACFKEYDLLKKLAERFAGKITIISIIADGTIEDLANFVKKSDYQWLFLHYGNQPDIIKQYDIRAFPVYYLIGPDGMLILSPAKGPTENIELELFKIMRARGDL
jgi:peroxiredoxin